MIIPIFFPGQTEKIVRRKMDNPAFIEVTQILTRDSFWDARQVYGKKETVVNVAWIDTFSESTRLNDSVSGPVVYIAGTDGEMFVEGTLREIRQKIEQATAKARN